MNHFYTDKPKEIKAEDHFQRYEFSKRIAEVILTQNFDKSLVIGLYGKWGEGKSSVLNFIEGELSNETVIIKFNPWLYSDEQNLLKSFFHSVAEALDEKIDGAKEKIGGFLEDYSGFIGAFTQFAGVSTDGLKDIGGKLKNTSIDKIRDKINDIISNSGKKIVVFMDDIDRLDVNEIQFVFKLVKLVADFPNTSYVLAFDDELVANALSPKYAASNQHAGYLFLEKIIQIPLKLPKANQSALRKYTLDLIQKVLNNNNIVLKDSEVSDFVNYFDKGFVQQIENPRLGVRFANSIAFSIPLLRGEVYLTDLMIVEGIKIFYPEFYDFIRQNSHLFLSSGRSYRSNFNENSNNAEFKKDQINKAIKIYSDRKSKQLFELLNELFPQMLELYKSIGYPEDTYKQWIREKRLCSGYHFNRYFSYVVQEGEISDAYFDLILLLLERGSQMKINESLIEAIKLYDASALILKFKFWQNDLTTKQQVNLAFGLCKLGDFLPKDGDFTFATPFGMAAGIVSDLLFKINKKIRIKTILEILKQSEPFEFAMEIEYSLGYLNQKEIEDDKLTNTDEQAIWKLLLNRFKGEIKVKGLFDTLSEGSLLRILRWWKEINSSEFLNRITQEIKVDKEFALKILKMFTPTVTSHGINGTRTYKSMFNQKRYDLIIEVLNPKTIYDALINEYGIIELEMDLDNMTDRKPMDDNMLIGVFQKLYEKNEKG